MKCFQSLARSLMKVRVAVPTLFVLPALLSVLNTLATCAATPGQAFAADRSNAQTATAPKRTHTRSQIRSKRRSKSSDLLPLDERPARPGEWGFRPRENETCLLSPPSFVWRPQSRAHSYELQCARSKNFRQVDYQVDGLKWNVHRPPRVFQPGRWWWRFRYVDKHGRRSRWSRVRTFIVASDAKPFPLPTRRELLARIPQGHPRLFLRPEQLPELRRRAQTDLKPIYQSLVRQCEKLVKSPPPTAEPPKYPPNVKRLSETWRTIWWGNRRYTIRVLNGAATLAFTYQLSGNRTYGQLAKRLLLAAAQWDPKGATGYRYNDEAGMPYAYYFSRTYSWVHDLLSPEERARCCRVMKIRGEEMYRHLCPRHLWRPYASHSNRAWHFLGEVAVAFHGEIPEADDWLWFAMNVFANVYPVWCDSDGGWHEGVLYWRSYITRFTWWADVMRVMFGINAYDKPYFSKIGFYPMYLQPPGTVGGGFGDLNAYAKAKDNVPLMSIFAAQSGNPYWQWYVDVQGGPPKPEGYIGFVRGMLPKIDARPPDDLPTSRCFHGVGQAMLNSNLKDARNNVEIIFKSSPFGSQSHGYEAQNAFLLYAFGRRLLIRSGRRDIYGSVHHKNWMWETKSVNSITVNGQGQLKHSAIARGRITQFVTSKRFDCVSGEAAEAYAGRLDRFTRTILFAKPDLIVIYDQLQAPKPSTFQWWLHAPTRMKPLKSQTFEIINGEAACRVQFLQPQKLKFTQTDKFDPPPRPRIKLTEYHLTASTLEPTRQIEFITLIRPFKKREAERMPHEATLKQTDNSYLLTTALPNGERLVVALRKRAGGTLQAAGQSTNGNVLAVRLNRHGRPVSVFSKETAK